MLFTVAPMLVAVGLGAWLVLSFLERELEQQMQGQVALVARALQLPLSHALKLGREGSIKQALASAQRIGRVYGAYLYDHKGKLIAALGRKQGSRDHTRIDELLGELQHVGEYGQVDGRAVYSYFMPLFDDAGRNLGLVQITRRKQDFRELMEALRLRTSLVVGAGATLITLIVLLGYHGAVGGALIRVRRAMDRIRDGDREHRAELVGPREVSELARGLNTMLDSMERAEAQVSQERTERQTLARRLQHSQKLAAIGQLAAGVAHELGTPLSVIDGRAQRALRTTGIPAPVHDALSEVRLEVGRMERIVRQLLEYARPVSGRSRLTDIEELMGEAMTAVEDEAAGRGVTIELQAPPVPTSVMIDPVRAYQAMLNLLKNAVQAARSRVRVAWACREDGVSCLVDDDGDGIAPEALPHLFEPFYTTKALGEGTGLGLAIADAVATEHGGWLEAKDADLGGARFELFFPITKQEDLARC